MAAAFIGVIGVLLGSVITALFNLRVEANRQRGAASLIAREVEVAAISLGSYAEAKKWGSDGIATDQWRINGPLLAAELQGDVLNRLSTTYALIDSWENKRASCAGQPVDEADVARLEADQKRLESSAAEVRNSVPRTFLARIPKKLWIPGAIAVLALGCGLLVALIAPRTEMTDRSVAAALASELDGETYVSCSHSVDRWHCQVGYPRVSCKASASPRPSATLPVSLSESVQSGKPCEARARLSSNPVDYEVAEGPEAPVATRDPEPEKPVQAPDPNAIKREKLREALPLDMPDPSYVDRAVDDLLGDD
jgi:hypothetical protein